MPGEDNPWRENFDHAGSFYHFNKLLQVSGESLSSLILCRFFHDFMHVYSPGAGADNPGGQNSACNRKDILFQSFM